MKSNIKNISKHAAYSQMIKLISLRFLLEYAKRLGALVPDYNHDKKIDDDDKKRAFNKDKYYFWINDDDDAGDTEGTDIPGATDHQNGQNDYVDGVRDLIDFFPVYLNIKNLLNIFAPNTNTYVLKTEGENMNIVIPDTNFFVQNSDNKVAVTDLMPDQAGAYLTDITTATPLGVAITQKIKKAGINLNNGQTNLLFMQRIKEQGKGIILEKEKGTGYF